LRKISAKRQQLLLLHDQEFLNRGFLSLAGVDEAGRGPLAGPVVASAVIVRDFSFLYAVDDSKKMSPIAREKAFDEILAKCVVGIGTVESEVIDEVNILEATFLAMQEAVATLGETPGCVLVDGSVSPRLLIRRFPIVDGDAKSFSIACASVIAKVTRDRMMEYYDELYPQYGFKNHKGYGTVEHVAAIKKHGPCKIHRKSFAPTKNLLTRMGVSCRQ
jgi:ribonuclease HII